MEREWRQADTVVTPGGWFWWRRGEPFLEIRQNDELEYIVVDQWDRHTPLAGPFPTLEGAKAAYVLMEAAR